MKTSTTTFNPIAVVKETLSFTLIRNKLFTAADMWNIERRKRSRIQRRFSL
jgi:hypothetical protein